MKAIIEIPKGSVFKYEVDKETGQLHVDRPLPSPLPYNYGYIENTLYEDGDPLDVCVVGCDPLQPLCTVKVIPIGVFICDDNGDKDDKLVAYAEGLPLDPASVDAWLTAVQFYLETYKPGFKVLAYKDIDAAYSIYEWSVNNAKAP